MEPLEYLFQKSQGISSVTEYVEKYFDKEVREMSVNSMYTEFVKRIRGEKGYGIELPEAKIVNYLINLRISVDSRSLVDYSLLLADVLKSGVGIDSMMHLMEFVLHVGKVIDDYSMAQLDIIMEHMDNDKYMNPYLIQQNNNQLDF